MQSSASTGSPTLGEVRAIIGLAPRDTALTVLKRGGGVLFPYLHGYTALGQLLDALPKDEWRRDEAVLGGLVAYLVKQGHAAQANSYLSATNLEFDKTYSFEFCRLLLALHLGDEVADQDLASWQRLERQLPVTEPLLQGLYHYCMLVMNVRLGHPGDARISGQHAISCFREARHSYLEHFIHIHLADLDLVEGRLRSARRNLASAESCLSSSAVRYANESAVIEVIRLAINYEHGFLDRVRPKARHLRASLLSGDSWSELFCQLARISVLSTYFLEGITAARSELAEFQADYARRHGGSAVAIELLAAVIANLEWQPGEAERIMQATKGAPPQCTIAGTLCAQMRVALEMEPPSSDTADAPRSLIIAALQDAHAMRGAKRRGSIEAALRVAVDEGQIAPFLEHRDAFLGVSSKLATGGFARGRRTLARFTTNVLKALEQSYVVPEPVNALGFNRRQYRVAAALQSGATNKQVARQLGVSEAAVKYHLTALYRMTGTSRRREFIDLMNEIGIYSNY